MKSKLSMPAIWTVLLLVSLLLLAGCTLDTGASNVSDGAPTAAATEGGAPKAETGTISVAGVGTVEVEPDLAVISVGVQTEAATANQALSNNSQQMDTIIATLKGEGVTDDDLKTRQVELTPRYREGRGGVSQITGYAALNILEIRIKDLNTLGNLLDKVVQAGGNRIESLRFEVADPAAVLDRARTAAWADARHRAEQLAKAAGASLGDVSGITETVAMPLSAFSRVVVGIGSSGTPVEPGTQQVQLEIQVTWRLMK